MTGVGVEEKVSTLGPAGLFSRKRSCAEADISAGFSVASCRLRYCVEISVFHFSENHALLRSSRLMQRAYASSRYVEVGCDGRGCCARRALASRTAKSCGPGLPMLRSGLLLMRKRHAGDGGKKARSPRRARRTPLKLIAQGGPGRPAGPVVPAACIFFAGGPRASVEVRLSLRLSCFETRATNAFLGLIEPRDRARTPEPTASGCLTSE